MRIGSSLSLGAGRRAAGGPIAPPPPPGPGPGGPAPLAPIPGILDAPEVVVLGASIMQGSFGANGLERQSLRDCAAAAGFAGTLRSYAQSGDKIADARSKFAQAKADLSATQGANLYIAHIGGNNVSGPRPYPGGADVFEGDYDGLIADVTATDALLPLPLTKRLYGKDTGYADPDSVIPGDAASEANGSKPYNDALLIPRIAAVAPDWIDAEGVPYVNPYELADRFPGLTNADGVHGYGAALGRYILAKVAGRALGIAATDSMAGQSILYKIGKGTPADAVWGADYNAFLMSTGGNVAANHPHLWGAARTDGGFAPHVLLHPAGAFQNGTTYGPDAFARIPDARFHHDAIVTDGVYLQGTQVLTLTFEGLVPGDRVTATCVGVRSATGTNRKSDVTVSAGAASQTLLLDAASNVPSNQVTFAPVTVPASGTVALSARVSAGSSYGYLHGVALDFA